MRVLATDDLRTVAFKVCTALNEAGVTVVLTGGSAATIYVPHVYQSRDLDFVQLWGDADERAAEALEDLGYEPEAGTYVHEENPLTLDFLPQPIAIGQDIVSHWDTLTDGRMTLFVLSPTDSCRDRLAHFLHWNDRAALGQAVAIAREHSIDIDAIRRWCDREGHSEKFLEFEELRKKRPGLLDDENRLDR